MKRRDLLKLIASAPLLGGVFGSITAKALPSRTYRRDYFTELGIRTFINGRGTITALSGTLMPPEVMDAINYASNYFVTLEDINDKVGERIAEMLNCEAAMVTAGAASAITLGTAACVTGMDAEKIRLIPEYPGEQPEVVIQKSHRFVYDHAIRNCGVKLVEVDSPQEMEDAINENTVMAFWFNAAVQWGVGYNSVEMEEFIAIAKRHNIPTFNDASADVPPVENLFKYIEMGFDLVTFSGGKAIRGPQSTGLLYGRKDLIDAARLNHSPHANTIGRGMKVNKEEILGMMVALELYLEKDHDEEWKEWENRVDRIIEAVKDFNSVETEVYIPSPAGHSPHLGIRWDEDRIKISPVRVVEELRNGHPSIEIAARRDELYISVYQMKPREADIVARRVREVLMQYV